MLPTGWVSTNYFSLGLLGLVLISLMLFSSALAGTRMPGSAGPSGDVPDSVGEKSPESNQSSMENPWGVAQAPLPDAPESFASVERRPTFIPTTTRASVLPRSGRGLKVPIFMYHYIRVNPNPSDAIGKGLSVAPADFERQMRYLVDNGYQSIGLDQLASALVNNTGLPAKSFVLTFDDGYWDLYQNAYPVLQRYNLKATSFVIADLVGARGYLTWDAIREMAASGSVTYGSHTLNHPDLTQIPLAEVERQIKQSKRILEDRLGNQVTLLSYPSGQYNSSVMGRAQDAGYVAAVSTRFGSVNAREDLFRLRRVRVDGRDGLVGFIANLRNSEFVMSGDPVPAGSKATPSPVRTPILTPIPKPQKEPTRVATPARSATPNPNATVPNLVGLSEADARGRLRDAGLDTGYVNYQSVEDVAASSRQFFLSIPVGKVVSHQPGAGTSLKRGDRVNLAVRKN
ncbi:MAG: polysaccharide deacetylase family protein [Chloroflexi bacterium]|nr:polysaccharide deacetylase family protein [Chloroflexota bacterium]